MSQDKGPAARFLVSARKKKENSRLCEVMPLPPKGGWHITAQNMCSSHPNTRACREAAPCISGDAEPASTLLRGEESRSRDAHSPPYIMHASPFRNTPFSHWLTQAEADSQVVPPGFPTPVVPAAAVLPLYNNRRRRVWVRLLGTVPQTGVLMVPHERNMRSKFR